MSFVLSHKIIEPPPLGDQVNAPRARKTAFVLHGVLGSGQNFRRFTQMLAGERPEYRYVLVDLRHHGQSTGAPSPNTLSACALDLTELGRVLGAEPDVLIGHSFGGKVAIEYARQGASALQQVWVLDSVPGAQDPTNQAEVAQVMAAVRAVPMPAGSRRDVVAHLTDHSGLSSGLAEWMTTNLKRDGEHYVWTFDLNAIEQLMMDYYKVDLWGFLAQPRERPEFRLVVAERSDRWTPELRSRGRALPASARVIYHELANAGHWVHVDNPAELLRLIATQLV
jgi:pimeloyl-ACP methyl ester carboxylesterase